MSAISHAGVEKSYPGWIAKIEQDEQKQESLKKLYDFVQGKIQEIQTMDASLLRIYPGKKRDSLLDHDFRDIRSKDQLYDVAVEAFRWIDYMNQGGVQQMEIPEGIEQDVRAIYEKLIRKDDLYLWQRITHLHEYNPVFLKALQNVLNGMEIPPYLNLRIHAQRLPSNFVDLIKTDAIEEIVFLGIEEGVFDNWMKEVREVRKEIRPLRVSVASPDKFERGLRSSIQKIILKNDIRVQRASITQIRLAKQDNLW